VLIAIGEYQAAVRNRQFAGQSAIVSANRESPTANRQ
jgi:hypothetical protein